MAPVFVRFASVALLTGLSLFTASAQNVVSARSGVLHLSDGAVFVGDQLVNQQYGTFPDIKEKTVLRTELGRAEVLLTPGVFLRLGENSSFKMIDNRLADTRVELLTGKAVVESDDPMKVNAVTIIYKDYQIHVRKAGVMEFQTNPEQIKVFHGEAEVELNGTITVVKAGRAMPFAPALVAEKFDAKNEGDSLTRWSEQRSGYVATANVSAAKSLRDSGTTWNSSGWMYNPFYSMYTYIPMGGIYSNPYGYSFFSPYTVYQAYYPGNYGGGYGGRSGNTGTANSGFGSSTISQRPSVGLSVPASSIGGPVMSSNGGGMGNSMGGGGVGSGRGGGGGAAGGSSVGGGRGK